MTIEIHSDTHEELGLKMVPFQGAVQMVITGYVESEEMEDLMVKLFRWAERRKIPVNHVPL